MGNSLRCCIACILPCGALDVVRVLHVDGRIDEYSRRITAGEVMKANPKLVLAQPICEALVKKPSFLHPDTELQKGRIYFLIPAYTLQKEPKSKSKRMGLKHSEKSREDECVNSPKECPGRPVQRSETALPRQSSDPAPAHCERARNLLGRRRIDGRNIGAWKPVLDSISEVDDNQELFVKSELQQGST